MSKFKERIRKIAESPNIYQCAPGFGERLDLVIGNRDRNNRDLQVPVLLSDLGVREIRDPATFWELNLEQLQIEEPIDRDEIAAESVELEGADFAERLDDISLTLGDYDLMEGIILAKRFAEIDELGMLYSSVVLASRNNALAVSYFDRLKSIVDYNKSPRLWVSARHREAAYQVKRSGNLAKANELLGDLDEGIKRLVSNGSISAVDGEVYQGMSGNLRALIYVKKGEGSAARKELLRARERMDLDGLRVVAEDESARYSIQQDINLAQLSIFESRLDEAYVLLKKGEEKYSTISPDYNSELNHALSYIEYLRGEYSDAIRYARRAERQLAFQACPGRLLSARKIIAAALYKSGFEEKGEKALEVAHSDPTGKLIWGKGSRN